MTPLSIHLLKTQSSIIHRFALTLIASLSTACGGAKVPSPELYQSITKTPVEYYKGDMDLSKLTSVSRFKESFNQSSLGRGIILAEQEGVQHTFAPPSPCHSLLPDRVRDDYRDRLSQVFDDYLLTRLHEGQTSLHFPATNFKLKVDSAAPARSIVSGYIGISRILSYVDDNELKYYDKCCTLTGACGSKMVSKLYEVSSDIRYLERLEPQLVKSLLSFETQSKGNFSASTLQVLAQRVHRDQAKAKPKKPELEISHIEFREIPKGAPSPFTTTTLTVSPSSTIKCKPKKSKAANVVEFVLKLEGIEGAQETFGFEVTTSKQWVDLSLAERSRLVKVGTGNIACYPGPDAFTNPDDRCPAEVILTAFPPACPTMQGDGDFKWNAKVSVYAPGDEERRAFHSYSTQEVITQVHKR